MKRIICFILVCLLLLGAAACGTAEYGIPSGASSDAAPSLGTSGVAYVPTAALANENEDDTATEPSDSEDLAGLGLFADYAEDSEPDEDSLFYLDAERPEILIKIWATEELKNFKFIKVIDDGPYAGEALFELEALAVGQVFYAKTTIGEGYSERGFSFEDENGETVCFRINYDGKGGGPTGFGLESIPCKPNASGEEDDNGGKETVKLRLFADYGEYSELEKDSLFFEEQCVTTLVKIWANKDLKNFKFITVIDDGPYAGETLYEIAVLEVGQAFYAETIIGEGYSERGFSFEDENGETVCYRIDYDGKGDGPMGFGLSRVPASPTE